MVVTDYSQTGEQAAILGWAAAQPLVGGFVDFGAFDGEQYSNTAALADLGWAGICVEAAPDAAAACAMRYVDRPDVEVIQAAFALEGPKTVTIHWVAETMYSSLTASRRPDVAPEPIEVPRLDLARFANQIGELPRPVFCSIDIEGNSLEALRWLLDNACPACVCVEANNPQERAEVREWLSEGWTELRLRHEFNLLFARSW